MAKTKEELTEAVEAYKNHGNQRDAAQAMGVAQSTFNGWMKRAGELGLLGTKPVVPGFKISQISSKKDDGTWVKQTREHGDEFEIPEGQVIKGVSAFVDAEGRTIAKWIKTKEGELSAEDIVETLKGAFDDVPRLPEVELTDYQDNGDGRLTLIPLADLHIGMMAWGAETGTNWDLTIARRVLTKAIDEVIDRSAPAETCVILGGGDLLHSDDDDNRTRRSGNALDVDGRSQKVLKAARDLMVHTIKKALKKFPTVIVRLLPGNHDERAYIAVTFYLAGLFDRNPRVTIDESPSVFWYHRHGNVLLGATHGHTIKMDQFGMKMAVERREDWGKTQWHYGHMFHIHHKSLTGKELNGVVVETHQTPTPQDAYHAAAGFLSGRSVQSITYHDVFGEISRARVAVLDGRGVSE